MMFEPIRFQKTNTEFYGKGGMSWNGIVLLYRKEGRGSVGNYSHRMPECGQLSTLLVEHIVRNCNAQVLWTAAIILCAIIPMTKIRFPGCSHVWQISDNTSTYHNDVIPAMAPFIAQKYGLLATWLHPSRQCAQDKSLLHASFSIAMRHIHRYVK